jgi:hypothetical protein
VSVWKAVSQGFRLSEEPGQLWTVDKVCIVDGVLPEGFSGAACQGFECRVVAALVSSAGPG